MNSDSSLPSKPQNQSQVGMLHVLIQKDVIKKIRQDELGEAINLLEKFIDENNFTKYKFSNSLAIIRQRLTELNRLNSRGVFRYDDYTREKVKISSDLLILLDDVDSLSNQKKEIKFSEIDSTEIWIVLDEPFEDFDEKKQQDLLDKLSKVLKVGSNIKILQKYPGSVRLLLKMPVQAAVRLYRLFKEEDMTQLSISDVYFGARDVVIKDLETSPVDKEANYWDIGFQLGLIGDIEFKDALIERFQKINFRDEDSRDKKVKDFLYDRREMLRLTLRERRESLNRNRILMDLFELFLVSFSSNNAEKQLDSIFLDNLLSSKQSELKTQVHEIKIIESKIEEIDLEYKGFVESLTKKGSQINDKILSVIEDLEFGFALGYAEHKLNSQIKR